jgi:hypothetical protein
MGDLNAADVITGPPGRRASPTTPELTQPTGVRVSSSTPHSCSPIFFGRRVLPWTASLPAPSTRNSAAIFPGRGLWRAIDSLQFKDFELPTFCGGDLFLSTSSTRTRDNSSLLALSYVTSIAPACTYVMRATASSSKKP